jgi:Uma2 family endonuclease
MMSVTTIYDPGPVSLAEYEALPDDGNRYELIDGVVYVSPAAVWLHQRVAARLQDLLVAAAPDDLAVVQTPGYQAGERTLFVPDVVVSRDPAPGAKYVTEPLPLAVEVLSPSSRKYDRVTKLAAYDRAGVGAYWIVDPDEPSLLVFEREGDRLVERAHVRGDESFAATRPFQVTVVPSALAARLR